MFKEIVTFICAESGFTLGTDLFAGTWEQASPSRAILVSESAGGATTPSEEDFVDYLIQVMSRSEEYFYARDDLWTIYNAIHTYFGANMPNLAGSGPDYLGMSIYAIAIPQYLGPDENGRKLFSCNFLFQMEEASCGL